MPRGATSRKRRTETPKPIWIKFCVVVYIPDVVTYTNFGDHRLRVFWGAGGSHFPLSHRLSSSPLQHSRTTVRACDNEREVRGVTAEGLLVMGMGERGGREREGNGIPQSQGE